MKKTARPYSRKELYSFGKQKTYKGEETQKIAFPLGGIGAGSVCLNGYGGLSYFSIRNNPETGGSGWNSNAFAALHIPGKNPLTRMCEGPVPSNIVWNGGGTGPSQAKDGFPRFRNSSFTGEYPFAKVGMSDPAFPLKVDLEAFNPFIPLDEKNSGIPCAVLTYTVKNTSKKSVSFQFSYHLGNLATHRGNSAGAVHTVLPRAGVLMGNEDHPNADTFGTASLSVAGHRPDVIKGSWFRGGHFDVMSVLWKEISEGNITGNKGTAGKKPKKNSPELQGLAGCSLMFTGKLKPGEAICYPVVITWHFPNSWVTFGPEKKKYDSILNSLPDKSRKAEIPEAPWHPWYSTVWKDAADAALYVRQNLDSLRQRSEQFRKALFSSTLPDYVLDAVSANLGILKSPTVLRVHTGELWVWEGSSTSCGCCGGSCTHVWNYAQALPHLFPGLERSLREQELRLSMDKKGHINFRTALPLKETDHDFHAAGDGQLGAMMKVYRDWQISGDDGWMKEMYPLLRKSLEFCVKSWDPDEKGVLIEPHHNTYDIEFWGPDGMCSSIYIGALSAMKLMARELGKEKDSERYEALAQKGAKYLDTHLFNGRYYFQKITSPAAFLRHPVFKKNFSSLAPDSPTMKLFRKEGPKYNYGPGCLSDGVIGAWMADSYGIQTPMTGKNIKKTLQSIFRYNWRSDLSDHSNPERKSYAFGSEPGLLICTWPDGGRPSIPFIYADEVWTGIEYQVASHLIQQGFADEGLSIVRGVRLRHNGIARNPWNEYECGNWYARALASYQLLAALSGFRYSKRDQSLVLEPKISKQGKPFKIFFSAADGYGTVTIDKKNVTVECVEGFLEIDNLKVKVKGKSFSLKPGVIVEAGKKKKINFSRG